MRELECEPGSEAHQSQDDKGKPASQMHTRTAVNEIREIFKALLSIDLSREVTLNLWRGKVGQSNSTVILT